jgi:nitrogen fixation protein NifB
VEDYDLIETVALKFYRTWLVNQTLDSKSPRS